MVSMVLVSATNKQQKKLNLSFLSIRGLLEDVTNQIELRVLDVLECVFSPCLNKLSWLKISASRWRNTLELQFPLKYF